VTGAAVRGAAVVTLLAAAPARAALTEAPRLAAVYDSILDARFDRVDAELKAACPPAPAEACRVLALISLWWQIQINPEVRTLDQKLEDASESAIAAGEAATKREPGRAEGWFYLSGAYAPRLQLRVLRGQRLAAARDGKRIKEALEHTLELDPTIADAHFGIGVYHYYADVAPTVAKMFRWLLWLPGGNRVQGLREMVEARDRGELLRGEADYQLHQVYLWFEHKPGDAIRLLEQLAAQYPNNPLFRQRIAEVHSEYFHDHAASANAWRALLARATSAAVYSPSTTAVRARVGLATELAAMNQLDEAIEQLQIVIATGPTEPPGIVERAERQQRDAIAQKSRR
jgi:hypothetical protein